MLTRKQLELLDFIKTRMDCDGVPPSFDEMKNALDLRSKSGIHRLITALEERMLRRATRANPALMAIKGVGPAVGAQLLITAGDNPDRLRTSASFAALCGTAPIPVSSGRTDKHRLSRGGDRQVFDQPRHRPPVPGHRGGELPVRDRLPDRGDDRDVDGVLM